MEKQFYSYPCEESNDCLAFLENGKEMSFVEFCKKHCDHCPDCVVLDIPYSEIDPLSAKE